MPATQTRRYFLTTLSSAGAAGLIGAPPPLAAEEALETTAVRLSKTPALCIAPQYIADELLRAEGFTDVRYVDLGESTPRAQAIAHGMVDFSANFVAPLIVAVASGEPITFLAGVHVGCFELFGNERIRSIADLKGKSVGVPALGSNQHIFLTAMVAHVGLDPVSDIHWVTDPSIKPIDAFVQGKITGFSAFRPSLRNYAPAMSGTSSSTVRSTGRGRNISAACWRAIATMFGNIRWQPNAYCVRC
jgi:NitT/TauT family transport system substrate-binding protein